MGLNVISGFKTFAQKLVQQFKEALSYLDAQPAQVNGTSADGSRCTYNVVRFPANTESEKDKSLVKVLLYWLYNYYFQPLEEGDSFNSRGQNTISLANAISEQSTVNQLGKKLRVGSKHWLQIGHIKLSEVLAPIFQSLDWSLDELKGDTALFQLKVEYVGFDPNASDPLSRLRFYYEPDSFRLSPFLFLFSTSYREKRDSSTNLTMSTILSHKEFCDTENGSYSLNIKPGNGEKPLYLTLRQLYDSIDRYLEKLGWNEVVKKASDSGANKQYTVELYEVNESDQLVDCDFYLSDLTDIFEKVLQGSNNCGVLLPMAHALFQPNIEDTSWYSSEHICHYMQKRFYTEARWPSPYSPVLMQQMAINLATRVSSPYKQPVFSVNGPPGTGKTTLLKDVIAQKVFERAKLIASMNNKWFEEPIYFRAVKKGDMKQFYLYPLNRAFKDCNMLVASCNNAAVENLTRELPDRANMPEPSALVGGEPIDVDYFSGRATKLLQELKKDQSEAWGLIAVPLGKRRNIECFSDFCLKDFKEELEEIGGDKPYARLNRAIEAFNEQLAAVEQAKADLDERDWYALNPDSDEAQKSNPFHQEAFNREREKLFYASLRVLKQFNALPKMRCNIEAAHFFLSESKQYSLLRGHSKEENNKPFPMSEFAPHAFDVLFSLVPVISTTFASVASMFADVKKPGRLGLLIVDEAGQASPHMAAGALWRASQAIVVGDPKQVEPVVKTDALVKNYCRLLLGLSRVDLLDNEISLQTIADVANPYGGYLGEPIPRNWVGCPLRVHRRCCEPMFTISNTTSYNGTMILGGDACLSAKKVDKMVLSKSCWYEVSGKTDGTNHYVAEQGEAALQIVSRWMDRWVAYEEKDRQKLFVISPFKSVVSKFREQINKHLNQSPQKKAAFATWSQSCVGTVHTFQGKEAEEVIILLGCDTTKVASAKWVNANMLNVAVTRAKCRVYFVGQWEGVWSQNKVFAENIHFKPIDSQGEPLVKVTSLDQLKTPANAQLSRSEYDQYLKTVGLDAYFYMAVLKVADSKPGTLYVMDMRWDWIYLFSIVPIDVGMLSSDRVVYVQLKPDNRKVMEALIFPYNIDYKNGRSYIPTGLKEAQAFVEQYVAKRGFF